MKSSPCDVLILGGGVIGLSCALYLLRAGMSVRVLERGQVGCGASHGNCGTITPSHAPPLSRPGVRRKALAWMLRRDAPLYVNPHFDWRRWHWLLGFARHCNEGDYRRTARARHSILQRSRNAIAALVDEYGFDCEFAPSGGLHVYRDASALAADAAEYAFCAELGIRVEQLDAKATQAMAPCLRDGVAGGVLFPEDASLRPDRYIEALAQQVRALGGLIDEGVQVRSFSMDGERIVRVHSANDAYPAGEVLMAMGAWTPLLARQLRLNVPVQPGKGYSQTWSRLASSASIPLVLMEASVCVTSWGSGYRLGSTMEFSGYDSTLNQLRLDAITRSAAQYLRQPTGPQLQEQWWGWRPMSVDEMPIIGRSVACRNLSWATGHGMLGVSMSAATGELIAAQLAGLDAPIDAYAYAPARFGI
ncbi:MAG: FAD-dependent oxidoreductase [Xanthomonadales bacterium]|nr:FAD-dependent oxidoreductase [Xanthomonadales bacterium]